MSRKVILTTSNQGCLTNALRLPVFRDAKPQSSFPGSAPIRLHPNQYREISAPFDTTLFNMVSVAYLAFKYRKILVSRCSDFDLDSTFTC